MFLLPYRAIERALAATHGIPEAAREAGFRSMLSNLQKLGALGEAARVGRGAPLEYTPDMTHRLVLTLELCELGVSPATAVALIAAHWEPKLKGICTAAERNNPAVRADTPIDPGDDVIVHFGGVTLRTGSLKGARLPAIPNINHCLLRKLPDRIEQWMKMGQRGDLPPRALMLNLSARLRAFHDALSSTYMEELRGERTAEIEKAGGGKAIGDRKSKSRALGARSKTAMM
jgi:hypothetical protein